MPTQFKKMSLAEYLALAKSETQRITFNMDRYLVGMGKGGYKVNDVISGVQDVAAFCLPIFTRLAVEPPPKMVTYAREQLDDPASDWFVDTQAIADQLGVVLDTVSTVIPKNLDGTDKATKTNKRGVVYITLSRQELKPLIDQMNALLALMP